MSLRDDLAQIDIALIKPIYNGNICIMGQWLLTRPEDERETLIEAVDLMPKIDVYRVVKKHGCPVKLTAFKDHYRGDCSCVVD